MASLVRPLRRAFLSLTSPSSSKALIRSLENHSLDSQKLISYALLQTRSYKSAMRKSAFGNNILRLIRNEIAHELEHCPQPPADQFDFYAVDCRPGEIRISLKGLFEEEEIKIDVSMVDGSAPASESSNNDPEEDVMLHITFVVDIYRRDRGDILRFRCSAWPHGIQFHQVFVQAHDQTFVDVYMGPEFEEMNEDMKDAFMDFLESRGINDDLAVFLHEYIMYKEKTERIRWMRKLMSSIENK